jgi:hypothetical protein
MQDDKKQRWGDQFRGGVMLDINHNAWRVYNNCKPFSDPRLTNKEYITNLIQGFVTNTLRQIARELMQVVEV